MSLAVCNTPTDPSPAGLIDLLKELSMLLSLAPLLERSSFTNIRLGTLAVVHRCTGTVRGKYKWKALEQKLFD